MEFFDGRQESICRSGRGWLGKNEIRGIYKPGQTPVMMAFSSAWVMMLLIFILFIPFTALAIFFGLMEDLNSGVNCFFVLFILTVFVVGFPSMIIIFTLTVISAPKRLKHNFIRVSDEFIEILYWKGGRQYPVQVTRVPFKYVKDIHPVTDEEWKADMKMGNIFRKLAMLPYIGPSNRFQPGTLRKNIYTLEMDRKMQLHGYTVMNETLRILLGMGVSPIFGVMGPDIQEELFVDDRIYISMSAKDHSSFVSFVRERMRRILDPDGSFHDRGNVKECDPEDKIDESSYMDLYKEEEVF